MHTLEKQISGDAEVSFGQGEKPKYRALREAINGFYADLLVPLERLRESVFRTLSIPTPRKQEEEAFRYLARHRRVIDEAISLFLSEIAGPVRTREGFVDGGAESDTPDGVIQQREVFAHAVGLRRGADLLDASISIPAGRQSPSVRAMLDNAFTRLSESGKLRLEGVRDEIHSIMVSAQDAGLSPIATARQLGSQFDQYKRFEFERLARTEAAFAAEEGSRNQMRELGVEFVTWLLDVSACPICKAYEGRLIPIDDTDNHPPAHPNCLCSTAPASDQEIAAAVGRGEISLT